MQRPNPKKIYYFIKRCKITSPKCVSFIRNLRNASVRVETYYFEKICGTFTRISLMTSCGKNGSDHTYNDEQVPISLEIKHEYLRSRAYIRLSL